MHKPERSRAALAQTWPVGLGHDQSSVRDSSVSMLRVKLVGVAEEPAAPVATRAAEGRTRRYAGALPSDEDCIAVEHVAENDDEPWHDVSGLMDGGVEPSYQALAFAHTLPAVTLEDLGIEESGVREIRRLQLWLDPRDAAYQSVHVEGPPTLRMNPSARNPVARAWEWWGLHSPVVAIWTVAVLCVLSALAVNLLAR